MNQALLHSLTRKMGDRFRIDEPMRLHTTWRVGGPCWGYAEVHDRAEARLVLSQAQKAAKTVKPLGRGSNLLVSDQGFDGVMLKLAGGFTRIEPKPAGFVAGGGASLGALVKHAADLGLGGLEWAVGIPATLGGAVAANAGALGSDMAGAAGSITLLLADGSVRRMTARELPAGYRRRELPEGAIVLEAELDLQPGEPQAVQRKTRAYLERRKASQPLDKYTCGSVFKNPAGDYAARLIEQAGLKGLRSGGAVVSPKHANFIENREQASARDIKALMDLIVKRVNEKFGVRLEPEVELVGHG